MDSREVTVCRMVGNERRCVKAKQQYIAKRNMMTKKEEQTAEAAKQGALKILRDALEKKDKVLMNYPDEVVLAGEARGKFWVKRHAILTEQIVKMLIAELEKVTFENIMMPDTFAYVYPNDSRRTVYLCTLFWKAPQYLAKDSQPGTLIHEVSHFLSTEDFTYKQNTIELCCKGLGVKGTPCLIENNWDVLRNAFWNANNIEYEFELTINHKGKYINSKYTCCEETARYSVCKKSVPDEFFTGKIDRKWKTEKLVKQLLKKSQTISPKMKKIPEIVDERKKSLSATKTGVSMSVFGGAAVLGGLLLGPITFGLSALIGAGGGTLIGGIIGASTSFSKATTAEEELYAIFTECVNFLEDFKSLIGFLNHGFGFLREYTQVAESWYYQVNIITDNIKEKTRSRVGNEQEMHALLNQFQSYMEVILEDTERLCKIFI